MFPPDIESKITKDFKNEATDARNILEEYSKKPTASLRIICCPSERHNMDIKELIKLLGFSLESQKESGSFGDFVSTYNSPYFRLRIVGDRGQQRIDLAFKYQLQEWFDLALIRFSLGLAKDDLAPISFEDGVSFLENHSTKIRELFNARTAPQIKSRLLALGDEGAKKMFPSKF